jgi:hypothetical protein
MLQYVRAGRFHCFLCKKNYTRQSKFEEHVDKDHPFYTTFSFRGVILSTETRLEITNEVFNYCDMLSNINTNMNIENAVARYLQWNPNEPTDKEVIFVWASDMLSPTTYVQKSRPDSLGNHFQISSDSHTNIPATSEDTNFLKNLVQNHLNFVLKIRDMLPKILQCDFEIIIEEFYRFLNLGKPWRGGNFCPSLLIDFIWHCTMMNHKLYIKISHLFFSGTILSHCLQENENKSNERSIEFYKKFNHFYHRDPFAIETLHETSKNAMEEYKLKLQLRIVLENKEKEQELERQRIFKMEYAAERQKEWEKIVEMKKNGTYVEPREYAKC